MELIDPLEVRFSQESVRRTFRDGRSIQELARALKDGDVSQHDIEPVRLIRRHGLLFAIDNRRLLAFQTAGVPMPCRMATANEVRDNSWKFTTVNEGTSVRVR